MRSSQNQKKIKNKAHVYYLVQCQVSRGAACHSRCPRFESRMKHKKQSSSYLWSGHFFRVFLDFVGTGASREISACNSDKIEKKTSEYPPEYNLRVDLVKHVCAFKALGCPLLVVLISRPNFVGHN